MEAVVTKILIGAVIGFIFKIVYDWFKSGRIEKGEYVKVQDCQHVREKCCIGQLKKDNATFKTRLDAVEKSLDAGRQDFRQIRQDISKMKEHMAGMKSLLETWIEIEKGKQRV